MNGIEIKLDTARLMRLKTQAPQMARDIVDALILESHNHIDRSWSGFAPPRSSPGEPPAIETGNLATSAERFSQAISKGAEGRLSFLAEYAAHLEYGTRIMAARPFLRPGVENTRRKAASIVKDVVKKYL